jgi:hypothetical protein
VKLDGIGLSTSAGALWASAWAVWLLTGAASQVPPWRAEETLARDEQQARARAEADDRAGGWSLDVGGTPQGHALGGGWGLPERRQENGRERRVRQVEADAADVYFESPSWTAAHASIRTLTESSVAVVLQVDGETRARWTVDGGWVQSSAAIGPVTRGRHRVTLRVSGPGLAVDAIGVGPELPGDIDGDRGFVGFVRAGLHARPAFVSNGARTDPTTSVVDAVHGWVAAALVAIVTGLGWAAAARQRGLARLSAALAFSTAALVLVFIALRAAGLPPGPLAVAAGLAAIGGLPLRYIPRDQASIEIPWRAIVPAALSLLLLTWFATRVVPPLDDQDLEVQATAHAMAHRMVPSTVTDRGTTWFFAHPPLLHTWVAGAFALSGRLSRVAYTDEAAREARARQPFDEAQADRYPPAHYDAWKRVLGRFFAEPSLWPTRQVNVLLASIAVGVLALVAGRVCGSAGVGLVVAAVLATFPEFLIRGAYGGYFAPALLLSVLLLAAIDGLWPARAMMATGALAFLADQKGLLIPAAWVLAAPRDARWTRVWPAVGAAIGVALFALWGLGIDAPTFVYDFAKQHVARRLAGSDIRLDHDAASWYPSIPELWVEFARHYGILFTAAAAAASVWALRSPQGAVRAAGVAVLWGALVFSLTDWRQTKHLSLLAAPALVAIAGAIPAAARGRRAALVLLAVAIASNLWTAAPLLRDFEALPPSTIW